MRILFRPRDKQVAVKPAEEYICFRTRLLIFACRSIEYSNAEVSRYAAVKSYLSTLNDVTLFSPPPPTCLASQVRLTCYLLFFLFSQSSYYHIYNWSLLLPSPLTVPSCNYSYSDSDIQIGKMTSWPFTCSCTVSSVFWLHHFISRSGFQRDHCCIVGLIRK